MLEIFSQDTTYQGQSKTFADAFYIIEHPKGRMLWDAGLAEGGSVTEDINVMTATPAGMTDVNVEETETVNEPQPMQVSYDELRARLPQQITDDIVNLLAESYEALADFAQIATQSDVDNFNSKYGVELVLPQEA